MKSIFKDSFNEFIIVAKDIKLAAFTLIAVVINLVLQIYQGSNKELMYIFLLPMLIVGSLLNVYQYITMPKLITTKEKNMVKFFDMKNISYGASLLKLIKSVLILILVSIGVVASITIIAVILGIIAEKIFSFSEVMAIIIASILGITAIVFLIIAIVRLYLFVPYVILVDVDKPINYCWELAKGKFWKILLIILFSTIFPLPSLLLNMALKSSPLMLFIMCVPLNFIVSNIVILVSINSLYYFMIKNPLRDIVETSNIEAI